jgi:hypothetical protein
MGSLSADSARQLAACRRDQGQAIALLLAVSTWADPHAGKGTAPGDPGRRGAAAGDDPVAQEETAAAEAVLRGAGWRVASIDAATPLAQAWQLLPRLADHVVPAGGYGTGTTGSLGAAR